MNRIKVPKNIINEDANFLFNYGDSFIREFDFDANEKRWKRYCNKASERLIEFLKCTFPEIMDGIKDSSISGVIADMIGGYYALVYFEDAKMEKRREVPDYGLIQRRSHQDFNMFEFIHSYVIPEKMTENDKLISMRFSLLESDIFKKTVDSEWREACKHFLQMKSAKGNINESNFLSQGLPETSDEIMSIFHDTLNWTKADIEHLVDSEINTAEMVAENMSNLQEKLEKQLRENRNLEKEVNLLRARNEILDRSIKATKSEAEKNAREQLESEISKKNDRILELERQINKMNKQIEELEKRKPEQAESEKPVELKNEPKPEVNVDTTLRYAFLGGNEKGSFPEKVKAEFPNSFFITDFTMNLNPQNIDAVVSITGFIPHSFYLGFKKQCNTKGIPFVHCDNINLKEIKKHIAEVL